MITFIGDIHGDIDFYLAVANNSVNSIQVGDFGYKKPLTTLAYSGLNPENHKVVLGNHDDYDYAPQVPHALDLFGMSEVGGRTFFYIRGGISLNRAYLLMQEMSNGPKEYWSQEELTFSDMLAALDLYKFAKPDIVVSHVPCGMVVQKIADSIGDSTLDKYKFHKGFRENTALLGDEMLKYHRPKLWVSGHMHFPFDEVIDKTRFVSLDMKEVFCYDED